MAVGGVDDGSCAPEQREDVDGPERRVSHEDEAASTAETTIDTAWMTIITRRLSRRSASTPAGSEKSANGAKRTKARSPTATGECVSSTISQASATFCIHVPLSETIWPTKYSR